MTNARLVLLTAGVLAGGGLLAPAPVVRGAAEPGFEIARTRTEAAGTTSAAGAREVQLRWAAELVNGMPDLSDDVEVGWQQVGGVEPTPFRVLIPAGCFVSNRRGARVEDFTACGVELSVESGAGGRTLVAVVDFDARVVARDDGSYRFDIITSIIPPDPVVPPDPVIPPDPVHAFLGILGGAAVQIAAGGETTMASPPLRIETVSGIEPTPF